MQVSTRWHRQSYKQCPAIAGRSDVEEDGDGDEDDDDEVTRMKTVSDTIESIDPHGETTDVG